MNEKIKIHMHKKEEIYKKRRKGVRNFCSTVYAPKRN